MLRIASFNVENLFARPKAFAYTDYAITQPILDAYHAVSELFKKDVYTDQDKARIIELLVELDIYRRNAQGAARRVNTVNPRWAWLRKNRGDFDEQPQDASLDVRITATGRGSWYGWVELAKEPTDETAIRMTARVIQDVDADILGIVEAEDRPSLVRFNEMLLNTMYRHVMLVDGNDERGIDVAIMTKATLPIGGIRSNVDLHDSTGEVFSRDCPQYEVATAIGTVHVLVNHFKSQSGGGGTKRMRQATAVRSIADALVARGEHVVVLGDLNEGPKSGTEQAVNLAPLYTDNSPLVDCWSLPTFNTGGRPGSYDACGLSNRLDYIFLSQSLVPHVTGGGAFRTGLWGDRISRPTNWTTYPEMASKNDQASDHAALFVDLDV